MAAYITVRCVGLSDSLVVIYACLALVSDRGGFADVCLYLQPHNSGREKSPMDSTT